MGQWLRLCTSTSRGVGSIPGQVAKIPHAVRCSQKFKNNNKMKRKMESLLRGTKNSDDISGMGIGLMGSFGQPRPREGKVDCGLS